VKVTAIFDIGKTNKKFYLFDEQLREVHRRYEQFEEIEDEDGFPCDDVAAITQWVRATFEEALQRPDFDILSVNFSAYGASFVHVDSDGKVVAPLYNYLKPFPKEILDSFYQSYGDPRQIATETASPPLGMLNSGLQLYWLKKALPERFRKIKWSIHLPQYLSFLFTQHATSDYASIGCHTALWDYAQEDYHRWVYTEGIDRILPPLSNHRFHWQKRFDDREIRVGRGIHDSSAALLPYFLLSEEPFLLLSTGTWSIALNPFNRERLTQAELNRDCLNFLSLEGNPVKASRLFLGNEYRIWTERLAEYFGQKREKLRKVKLDPELLKKTQQYPDQMFKWESLQPGTGAKEPIDMRVFPDFRMAYHKLMRELTALQVDALRLALGNSGVKRIYVDGGFVENELFLYFLKEALPDYEWLVTDKPFGSAVGAALVMQEPDLAADRLSQNFNLRSTGLSTL